MNEQIKELEKQCWSHRVDGVLVDGHLHFDTEKFAELIVGKCLNMIENEASTYAEPVWAVELVNDIKEHFGVE
jgi:hypothetical protein